MGFKQEFEKESAELRKELAGKGMMRKGKMTRMSPRFVPIHLRVREPFTRENEGRDRFVGCGKEGHP